MKQVRQFVANCLVCQGNKYDSLKSARLLQPLQIPSHIWEDLSMDFIFGLPRSKGMDCILVVMDRLSKYAHFLGLQHPFTAKTVAEVFTKEIIRLHGVPQSIVTDQNPLFMSNFWREIFNSMGTTLKMSSSYHSEADGQTEVLNHCLETYLRCFSSEQPKQWSRWLSSVEFCYNTRFQSAASMTPFKAIYGRTPPTLKQFLPGEVKVHAVAEELRVQDEILRLLHRNLERAQQRMRVTANKHRQEVQFQVGDMVLMKLQPYQQFSVHGRANQKLSARFYGPYKVVVTYKQKLPESSRVHPVFLVSLLRRASR